MNDWITVTVEVETPYTRIRERRTLQVPSSRTKEGGALALDLLTQVRRHVASQWRKFMGTRP